MVFVPLFKKMLETMSWRDVFRTISPFFAGVLVLTSFFIRFPTHIAEAKRKQAAERKAEGKRSFSFDFSWFFDELWRRWTYAVVLAAMGYFTPFAFMSVLFQMHCYCQKSCLIFSSTPHPLTHPHIHYTQYNTHNTPLTPPLPPLSTCTPKHTYTHTHIQYPLRKGCGWQHRRSDVRQHRRRSKHRGANHVRVSG